MKKVISLTLALLVCISLCVMNVSALEAEGFIYTEDDGKAVITGYEGSDTDLTIPATLGGLKVEEIADKAFYQNHDITSVTIENGIEEIGEKAFYNCTGLTKVTIPDSVTDIGNSAFSYCVYLEEVTLGNGLEEISNNCFSHDTRIESIVIPEGVEELDDGAFEECTHLSNITLPDTLKEIGKYAFAYTYSLSNITLPNNLEVIDEGAFYFNSALTLIQVPSSVKTLGNYAFYANTALATINLNEGLQTIGDLVFDGTAAKTLYIPSTVVTAGSYPFGYTYNEETLEYEITPGFVALCKEGSYGAQLCEGFGIPYMLVSDTVPTNPPAATEADTKKPTAAVNKDYKKGDVNTDGEVNKIDTTAIQKHLAYLEELSDSSLKLADFDSSGKVNVKDIAQIQISISKH